MWSPRAAQEAQGEFADVPVTGKITIAAGAGGLVLGRGGTVTGHIRSYTVLIYSF